MKVLITGSNGFLGMSAVAEALASGHTVRALLRPASSVPSRWRDTAQVETVRGDLRDRRTLKELLAGCDAVVHLAADKAGDFYSQMTSTVVATENLLAEMHRQGVQRLVHCSTFSVYDYQAIAPGSVLDERSPVYGSDPVTRDDYARTKLIQENIVRAWGDQPGHAVTIIRPGVIYGRNNLWNARLGFSVGSRFICTGSGFRVPLTYVSHCAQALILAVGRDEAIGEVINVVDDDPPTQKQFIRLIQQQEVSPKRLVRVPGWVMRSIAWSAVTTNKCLFGGRAKLPGILIPARLAARIPNITYDNRKAHDILGWQPRYTLEQAIRRSVGSPIEQMQQQSTEPVFESHTKTISEPSS